MLTRESHGLHLSAFSGQPLFEYLGLGRLAASVQAFQDNKGAPPFRFFRHDGGGRELVWNIESEYIGRWQLWQV